MLDVIRIKAVMNEYNDKQREVKHRVGKYKRFEQKNLANRAEKAEIMVCTSQELYKQQTSSSPTD